MGKQHIGTMLLFILLLSGCGEQPGKKVTIYKTNRIDGKWEDVGTFYGFVDNHIACDKIAAMLEKDESSFSGLLKSQWKCE